MLEQDRRRLARAGRERMRSPGRPPVARREDRQRFWAAIRRGLTSEDAAAEAGVPPVAGTRWFREAAGMPPVTRADGAAVPGPDVRWAGGRHGRRADRRWATS